MSETSFPINDLLRRRSQTSLTVTILALCVCSTVSLLLLGEDLGIGVLSMTEERLTASVALIFVRFIQFIVLLIIVVGAVVVSFTIYVMMVQRKRDIGLMKAAGCTNELIFGYFMNELLLVVFLSCLGGVILGILVRFGLISLFGFFGFQIWQMPVNFWLVALIFGTFFLIGMIFGTKPILDTTKIRAATAISPIHYLGLTKEPGFKSLSKYGYTSKIALRSLSRRKSATFRIVLCLVVVFMLATVVVASGLIASQTTADWIERTISRDIVVVGHQQLIEQYELLLSKFHAGIKESFFNYTRSEYLLSEPLVNDLSMVPGVRDVDLRLITQLQVKEIQGYYIDPDTLATIPVGDNRSGECLVIGVHPRTVLSSWFVEGRIINESKPWQVMIGDSVSHMMFSKPLSQSLRVARRDFDIVGTCIDPISNGNVAYVSYRDLANITGISKHNIALLRIEQNDRLATLSRLQTIVSSINPDFGFRELDEVLDKDLGFLSQIWSVLMSLPLLTLASASLCLVGYVVLSVAEQQQEFGILRAIGARQRFIMQIISMENMLVLLASCAIGISLGTMLTLIILIPEPIVTGSVILEIAGILIVSVTAVFACSLVPALFFARKPILKAIGSA